MIARIHIVCQPLTAYVNSVEQVKTLLAAEAKKLEPRVRIAGNVKCVAEEMVSPIGMKEPGTIGVMEPDSGEENGHPDGLKIVWIARRWQASVCPPAAGRQITPRATRTVGEIRDSYSLDDEFDLHGKSLHQPITLALRLQQLDGAKLQILASNGVRKRSRTQLTNLRRHFPRTEMGLTRFGTQ